MATGDRGIVAFDDEVELETKNKEEKKEEEEEVASTFRAGDVNICETCYEREAEDMFGGVECWNCFMEHKG